MRKLAGSIPTLYLLALTACAPPQVDLEAAREELLSTDREWSRTAAAGEDVEAIVDFWTEDARVFPPGHPVVEGKEALRQYVASSLEMPGFSISWEPADAVVGSSGQLGYTWGENKVTYNDADGNLVTLRGRYMTVWLKGEDGSWRCSMDIWNAAPGEG